MRVFMYNMYICMIVCMYACMCVGVSVCTHACVHACACVCSKCSCTRTYVLEYNYKVILN